jgi:hypothetical protein
MKRMISETCTVTADGESQSAEDAKDENQRYIL